MSPVVRLGRSLGAAPLIWAAVPVLLSRAAPGLTTLAAVAIAAAGLAGHLSLKVISNRGWFAGDRSPVLLIATTAAISVAIAAALAAVAALVHRASDDVRDLDATLLTAAGLVMATLLASAFTTRVEFRSWIVAHRRTLARARPFATAPIGPDRGTVHDLVRELAESDPGAAARTPALVAERALIASDDRYRRALPWATASPLLAAFVDHVGRWSACPLTLTLGELPAATRVTLGGVCDALDALAASPAVASIDVAAPSDRATDPQIRITATLAGGQAGPELAPATARALWLQDVAIERPGAESIVLTARLGATPVPPADPEIDAYLEAPFELLAESPFSAGARRVYRRGNSVIKIQRHDTPDPKPTLLEDEYHLLRQLRARSRRFPAAIGYGVEASFSWIAYRFAEGRLFDEWLEAVRGRERLLAVGVDLTEMLDLLAARSVAHRDLNPGNMVVGDDGSLVLIDFDQSVAGPLHRGADVGGVEDQRAKNDLEEFLHRAGLTRPANELVDALRATWPDDVPYSLGVFGHRFGRGWHLDPLLDAARVALHPLAERHVVDLCGTTPIAGLLLAAAGARVTAVVDDPARWQSLARLAGERFSMVTDPGEVNGDVDAVWRVGSALEHHPPATWVVDEYARSIGPVAPHDSWFVTTELTSIGTENGRNEWPISRAAFD